MLICLFCDKKLSKYLGMEEEAVYGHYNCPYNLELTPNRNNLCTFRTKKYQFILNFDNSYEYVKTSSIYNCSKKIVNTKTNINNFKFDIVFDKNIENKIDKLLELS